MGKKLEKNISQRRGGVCLIMAMSTDAFWGGHFSVEPGIFLSNRAFFCRTMHFAVEPGFFVSDECYNWWQNILWTKKYAYRYVLLYFIFVVSKVLGGFICFTSLDFWFRVSSLTHNCQESDLMGKTWPGHPFTKVLWAYNWNLVKILFPSIYILIMWSHYPMS